MTKVNKPMKFAMTILDNDRADMFRSLESSPSMPAKIRSKCYIPISSTQTNQKIGLDIIVLKTLISSPSTHLAQIWLNMVILKKVWNKKVSTSYLPLS